MSLLTYKKNLNNIQLFSAPFYDGVPMITQFPILPHTTFRYILRAVNKGTHWYHSHVGMQRSDGIFGALIIREPKLELPPSIEKYYNSEVEDCIMTVQDWDHKIGSSIFSSFHHSIGNNKPKNILINGKGRYIDLTHNELEKKEWVHTPYEIFTTEKGKIKRFRLINSGFLNCPMEVSIDNHSLIAIASDGHYIDPISVDSITLYAGERFDFFLISNQAIANYWIRVKGTIDCDERFFGAHQGAILHYYGADSYQYLQNKLDHNMLSNGIKLNKLNSLSVVKTSSLESDTKELQTKETDIKYYVHYDFYEKNFPNFNSPILYSNQKVSNDDAKFFGPQMNHVSMKNPSEPLLMNQNADRQLNFCNSTSLAERNMNCREFFCECFHVLNIPLDKNVEIILIDEGYKYDANHPFHLHGYDFRVIGMEQVNSNGVNIDQVRMNF